MGRIVFTTCGTSVLQSACWKIDGVKLESLCGAEGADLRGKIARNEKKVSAFREIHRDAQSLADTVDTTLLKEENIGRIRDLPAEVASLVALDSKLGEKTGESLLNSMSDDDTIYLMHSTDVHGEYCAEVIGILLKQHFFPRIKDKIKPIPIEGLDPRNHQEFERGIKNLYEECWNKINEHKQAEFVMFNLTGGYKAMGIALGAICHKLASSCTNTLICYLHEAADISNISFVAFPGGSVQARRSIPDAQT